MNSTDKHKSVFRVLLAKSMEGEITVDEIREFNHLLSTYPDLESYYIQCVLLQYALCEIPITTKYALPGKIDISEAVKSDLELNMDSNVLVSDVDSQEILSTTKEKATADGTSPDSALTQALLELAEHEKTAPAIVIPKEKTERELIQKVVYSPREKYKMSTFHKIALTASAAIILVLVSLILIPRASVGVEVATLVDQMNVQWDDSASKLEKY